MVEFIKAKKNYLIAIAVLFVFISLSETTYSLFLKQDSTDEFNYNTGLLDLTFTEDEPITLNNAFPIVDSEGSKQKDYKLTVKNTGSLPHLFNLKMISSNEYGSISYQYIKVKVNDYLPHSLAATDNVIASNVLLYPNEETTFNIKIWLDNNTPNNELGKSFVAKITSSGIASYKTLDTSGANKPKMNNDMLPVYYDENTSSWHLADRTNNIETYKWYDYANKIWANSVVVDNTTKYIFDELRNNDLLVTDYKTDNGNIITENKYLDIKLANYSYDDITQVFRLKYNDISDNNLYIISNGKISYYYDFNSHKFVFKNGSNTVTSNEFDLNKNEWYILGYTYNEERVAFYANGQSIGSSNIEGTISNGNSFKLGSNSDATKVSKMIIGNVLTYHRILSENEFANNFKISMNNLSQGLISAYHEFTPMTLKEYYLSKDNGTKIINSDISNFYVWIPRFKYRVWNVMGNPGTDSYDALHNGINIEFETGSSTSGTITCKNNECFADSLGLSKISEADNGKYYTHPAFTYKDNELTGFWVSKYEIGTSNNECNDDINNCTSKDLEILSTAGKPSWRNNNLSNYYQAILKLGDNNYRVIKNIEWAAITYLTHSNYGICINSACPEIEGNISYISGNSKNDSTTGNIYGVYDMAGSAIEYTMGNYAANNDINLNNTSFLDAPISNVDVDLYTKDSFILGDATKEIQTKDGIWYKNTANNISEANNWIIRGGNTTGNFKGMFSYGATNDIASEYISTRIVYK